MADDKTTPDEQQTPDTESIPVKRRLRTAPQTMRERSEKIQTQKEKTDAAGPGFVGLFLWGFTWPLRWLFRQIAKLNRFKVFRAIGLVLLPRYIRNSWRELKLVTWPNAKQTIRLTYAVLIFSVIFGVIVAIIDFGLNKLFKELILK